MNERPWGDAEEAYRVREGLTPWAPDNDPVPIDWSANVGVALIAVRDELSRMGADVRPLNLDAAARNVVEAIGHALLNDAVGQH